MSDLLKDAKKKFEQGVVAVLGSNAVLESNTKNGVRKLEIKAKMALEKTTEDNTAKRLDTALKGQGSKKAKASITRKINSIQ